MAPRTKSEPVEPKQSLVIPAGNTPPELQALRSKRDAFRANLQYAIRQEEVYRKKFEAGDELAELKMLEQRLRVDWYSKKIAEVEQEIRGCPDHRGISRSAPPLDFSCVCCLARGGVENLGLKTHPQER